MLKFSRCSFFLFRAGHALSVQPALGDSFTVQQQAAVGEMVDVSVSVVAPLVPGRYTQYFRLVTADDTRFGNPVFIPNWILFPDQLLLEL